MGHDEKRELRLEAKIDLLGDLLTIAKYHGAPESFCRYMRDLMLDLERSADEIHEGWRMEAIQDGRD